MNRGWGSTRRKVLFSFKKKIPEISALVIQRAKIPRNEKSHIRQLFTYLTSTKLHNIKSFQASLNDSTLLTPIVGNASTAVEPHRGLDSGRGNALPTPAPICLYSCDRSL